MNRRWSWPDDEKMLRLARRTRRCRALGPGVRAVLWVQGCALHCPGCAVPETLPFAGGEEVDVEALARELTDDPGIEGVTFSGGEPMAQAPALCRLIDRLRDARDLSILSYTGYTLEALRRSGTPAQRALLDRLDILIDGPFLRERQTDLRWRGSDNQRVHLLTPRHRGLHASIEERGIWIEFEVSADGAIHWMGIPPPGFGETVPRALRRLGVLVQAWEGTADE
jgi:anaerobic ribonucleoside-triphosphate reductase activating protein